MARLGRTNDAPQRRDYPAVQGGVLLVATMIILRQPAGRPAVRRGELRGRIRSGKYHVSCHGKGCA